MADERWSWLLRVSWALESKSLITVVSVEDSPLAIDSDWDSDWDWDWDWDCEFGFLFWFWKQTLLSSEEASILNSDCYLGNSIVSSQHQLGDNPYVHLCSAISARATYCVVYFFIPFIHNFNIIFNWPRLFFLIFFMTWYIHLNTTQSKMITKPE